MDVMDVIGIGSRQCIPRPRTWHTEDREIERRYEHWFLRWLPLGVSLDLPMNLQLETILQTRVPRTA